MRSVLFVQLATRRKIAIALAALGLAAGLSLTVSAESPPSTETVHGVYDAAMTALYAGNQKYTPEVARQWRDRMLAAVERTPDAPGVALALLEAGRLSIQLPELDKGKSLLLRVLEMPSAAARTRMDAAEQLMQVAIEPELMLKSLDAYEKAAVQAEQVFVRESVEQYSRANDRIFVGIPFMRGDAYYQQTLNIDPSDPRGKQLARQAIAQYDLMLAARPESNPRFGTRVPARRVVLRGKGLAAARAGDEALVIKVAEEMVRTPVRSPRNMQESVGEMLRWANEILHGWDYQARVLRQVTIPAGVERYAFLFKHERLVDVNDSGYAAFQQALIWGDVSKRRFQQAIDRVERLLDSQDPTVRWYLDGSPSFRVDLLFHKAEALAGLGRKDEAAELYRSLPSMPGGERKRESVELMLRELQDDDSDRP